MDQQYFEQNEENSNHYFENKRSQSFETAALFLGGIAIATSCCIYSAIFCGALSIMFALLSRGGEMTLSYRGKTGLWLGIIGIVVTVIFYAYSFYSAIHYYGGIDEMMQAFYSMSGLEGVY